MEPAPVPLGEYVLSCQLITHEGPIRSLAAGGNGTCIVSGSQDATAQIWTRGDATRYIGNDFQHSRTMADHDHWVVSVAAREGIIVTGCMDKLIRVYGMDGSQQRLLTGHSGGVISLGWTAGSKLISGSWDGTAKVWDIEGGQCLMTLEGHENGVCVAGLPNGNIATGSTGRQGDHLTCSLVVDSVIRLWDGNTGKLLKVLKEHTGPVRSLCVMSCGDKFMSTSNDGSVRVWTLDGFPMGALFHPLSNEGQPAFVLGGCALPGAGQMVSVDESGMCLVWDGESEYQRIKHPNSLWCCASLGNGDFVTGCQDNIVRVWTRCAGRAASDALIASFAEDVQAAQVAHKQGPSGVEISKLPMWDRRHMHVGKSDGFVQMFQRDNKAIAAHWSSDTSAWIEIGEVTGSQEAGKIDGTEYDHVFPIEIEGVAGEVRKLQIGHNNGDNPFMSAQQFIDKHELPQTYLGQIADYVTKRAGAQVPTLGAEASTNGSGAAAAPRTFKHFPALTYASFDTGSTDKILAKLREFNGQVEPHLQLGAAELVALESLAATIKATSRYHSSRIAEAEALLLPKLASWPVDKVFPCLDLMRLAVLHPHAAEGMGGRVGFDGPALLKLVLSKIHEGKDVMPVSLCGLRFLCNMAKSRPTRDLMVQQLESVLGVAELHCSSANKNVQLAAATLAMNAACSVRQGMLVGEPVVKQLTAVLLSLSKSQEESTIFRAEVGLGTLLTGQYGNVAKAAAGSMNAAAVLGQLRTRVGHVGEAANE
ncbi:unnamed protein product, partial [Chrysoparadoxa australica]